MFNEEFYPTPKHIISEMVRPYKSNISKLTILEPSAGKGDILDYITKEIYDYEKPEMYCIEPNKELQYILQEKGYRVIGEDFLNYNGDYFFDLIIMNPAIFKRR